MKEINKNRDLLNKRTTNGLLSQMWMKNKVNESKLLVLDVPALANHLTLVVKLLKKQKWRVVIPYHVTTIVEGGKYDNRRYKDAYRWICKQLSVRGDYCMGGYLRWQEQSNQAIKVPLVSYPPKQHKLAWGWFQVLECCHWFAVDEAFPGTAKVACWPLEDQRRDVLLLSLALQETLSVNYPSTTSIWVTAFICLDIKFFSIVIIQLQIY